MPESKLLYHGKDSVAKFRFFNNNNVLRPRRSEIRICLYALINRKFRFRRTMTQVRRGLCSFLVLGNRIGFALKPDSSFFTLLSAKQLPAFYSHGKRWPRFRKVNYNLQSTNGRGGERKQLRKCCGS